MAKNTNWRVPARADLGWLDQEQVDDLFVEAFMDGGSEAQSVFRLMVQSHPEKISGINFFSLISHAVLNDAPELRDFAKQQVVDLLKVRGAAEPQLVKMVLDARIVAEKNEDPELRNAARQLIEEVQGLFPEAARPTLGQRARGFFHLSR